MEMIYRIQFTAMADDDIIRWKKSGHLQGMRKITQLLKELELHPHSGSGKPEQLKHDLSGWWSRRIDSKHRIVYQIHEESKIVTIHDLWGHYADK